MAGCAPSPTGGRAGVYLLPLVQVGLRVAGIGLGFEMREMMEDFDSTLIRRGRKATTFADMVEFTQSIHQRPFGLLLEELPGLARLSDTKFNLATKVLRRRFVNEAGLNQGGMQVLGDQIARQVASPWVAERIRSIFRLEDDIPPS